MKDKVEKVTQKARRLSEDYSQNHKVFIQDSRDWSIYLIFRCSGRTYNKRLISQSVYLASGNRGVPYICVQCGNKSFDLGILFKDILNPTELELEEFELEMGMPFILTKEGLERFAEGCSWPIHLKYRYK